MKKFVEFKYQNKMFFKKCDKQSIPEMDFDQQAAFDEIHPISQEKRRPEDG